MRSIAVIMTVHNRAKQTIDCLSALYKSYSKISVYMTDDGSTDDTLELVSSKFSQVVIIKGDGDLYWNRGMYLAFDAAIAHSEYDYYLFINNDTIIYHDTIEKLLQCAQDSNDEAIICGCTHSNKSTKEITYGGYNQKIKALPISENMQQCYFASGNILLIPSKIQKVIGNLDKFYRHALGDFDYEGRARKNGFTIIQAPGVCGVCDRHSQIPVWRNSNFPLFKRLSFLYSPLGRNPIEFMYFDSKHNNIFVALLHFCTLHIRCLFPTLWGKRYNEKE